MPDPHVVAAWLKALANPTRLCLVSRLIVGPAASGELASAVRGERSDVSAHLMILYRGGVVTRARAGVRMVYSLAGRMTRRGTRVTLHGPGVRAHIETGAQ